MILSCVSARHLRWSLTDEGFKTELSKSTERYVQKLDPSFSPRNHRNGSFDDILTEDHDNHLGTYKKLRYHYQIRIKQWMKWVPRRQDVVFTLRKIPPKVFNDYLVTHSMHLPTWRPLIASEIPGVNSTLNILNGAHFIRANQVSKAMLLNQQKEKCRTYYEHRCL